MDKPQYSPPPEECEVEENVRAVDVYQSKSLPVGQYSFIPLYCTDVKCDCRQAKIKVYLNAEKHIATIHHGWESVAFYSAWMGAPKDDPMVQDMKGTHIDTFSPIIHNDILHVFKNAYNDERLKTIQRNYTAVKQYQINALRKKAWRRPRKTKVKRIR